MNPFCRRIAIVLVMLPLTAGIGSAQEKSLYQRLGGYDGIAAVLDDFIGRLAAEQQLQRFFAGHSKNSEMRQRQLVLDLVCQLTGGPCFYIGRDLKVTHAGLGITRSDWELVNKRFAESLAKFKVAEPEQKELGALVGAVEKDIVEKP